MAVDIRAEGYPSSHVLGNPIEPHHGKLTVDHVNPNLNEVVYNGIDVAIGMIPDVHSGSADLVEHNPITWLEHFAPGLGVDQQLVLPSPVVGEMQAIVLHLSPLVDPTEVEVQQVIQEPEEVLGLNGGIEEEVLHATQLLKLLEVGDPGTSSIPTIVVALHVTAIQSSRRWARVENLGPLVLIVLIQVGDRPFHGDPAYALGLNLPGRPKIIDIAAALVERRVVRARQIAKIVPSEILSILGQNPCQVLPVLQVSGRQDGVRDGSTVWLPETNGSFDPFSAVHALLYEWAQHILIYIVAFAAPAAVIISIKSVLEAAKEK